MTTARRATPADAAGIACLRSERGPTGLAIVGQQPVFVYFIPAVSKNVDAAKEFLLNLSANDAASTYQSELYNLPAFPAKVPQLDAWLADDPFGSRPSDKLKLLQGAGTWTADIGYPGPPNPAVGEVFTRNILPQMMARAARGEQTPKESVAQAEAEIKPIFDRWRSQGLVR